MKADKGREGDPKIGKMGRRRLWMPLIQKLRNISNKLCTYLKVKPTNHFLVVLIRPTYLDGISRYTLHSSAIILLRIRKKKATARK